MEEMREVGRVNVLTTMCILCPDHQDSGEPPAEGDGLQRAPQVPGVKLNQSLPDLESSPDLLLDIRKPSVTSRSFLTK